MKRNVWTIGAKHVFCLLALAVIAVLTLSSCEKEPKEEPYREPYEKELRFNDHNDDSLAMSIVKKFAKDAACKHIYLTVTDDNNFTSSNTNDINAIRNYLGERIELAPNKISGRGNFRFSPGLASVKDSLWFVQNGWTVRQYRYVLDI